MSFISKLFSGKTKERKVFCKVSNEPMEKGYGYLLTTADIVRSKKYWDAKMTEGETMSYTINHFTKGDKMATQIRKMIFEKFSMVDSPWIVSDSYIDWFDVDKNQAKENARTWWSTEGTFTPEMNGNAIQVLPDTELLEIRKYAIMEAGSKFVPTQH